MPYPDILNRAAHWTALRNPAAIMDLDDELCLCFHVTCRKVVNFLRVEQPQRVGQLAECFGAGTGCGWCRPFLRKLFEEARERGDLPAVIPDADSYAAMRQQYLRDRKRAEADAGDLEAESE